MKSTYMHIWNNQCQQRFCVIDLASCFSSRERETFFTAYLYTSILSNVFSFLVLYISGNFLLKCPSLKRKQIVAWRYQLNLVIKNPVPTIMFSAFNFSCLGTYIWWSIIKITQQTTKIWKGAFHRAWVLYFKDSRVLKILCKNFTIGGSCLLLFMLFLQWIPRGGHFHCQGRWDSRRFVAGLGGGGGGGGGGRYRYKKRETICNGVPCRNVIIQ